MNSVLVAEHHKILEADILWEMCVCIIVDYVIIHPLSVLALLFFSENFSFILFCKFCGFTFTALMFSK